MCVRAYACVQTAPNSVHVHDAVGASFGANLWHCVVLLVQLQRIPQALTRDVAVGQSGVQLSFTERAQII